MTISIATSSDFHLVIQTNSPGELSAWVQPLVASFKERCPYGYVTLCLVPCQYASGYEYNVAVDIEGINEIVRPFETIKFLIGLYDIKKQSSYGAVLCLGGDPLYAQLLGFRLKFPSSAYTEHKNCPGKFFKHIFYKHKMGDLMAVKVQRYKFQKIDLLKKYKLPNRPFLLILLGSRLHHFEAFSSFWVDAIPKILINCPDIDILISISSFIPEKSVQDFKKSFQIDRVHVRTGLSLDFMAISKAMVSLPGTNTAEAMYMHCPMLTLCPLNKPHLIATDGLLGLVAKIPFLGSFLIKAVLPILIKKIKFVSLPNKINNKKIVPEFVGILTSRRLINMISNFILNDDKLAIIKRDLKLNSNVVNVDQFILDRLLE